MSMFRRKIGERSLPDQEDSVTQNSVTQNSVSNIPKDTFSETAGEIVGWVLMGLVFGFLGKVVFNLVFL